MNRFLRYARSTLAVVVGGISLAFFLDIMHLMPLYAPDKLLVCDNDFLLQNFWPRFHFIDLNFPMLTKRAVDGLLWRLENPDAPNVVVYQSPRLEFPEPFSDKMEELS